MSSTMDFFPLPKIWAKTTDAAFKTVSKKVFQKTAEVSNDLIEIEL